MEHAFVLIICYYNKLDSVQIEWIFNKWTLLKITHNYFLKRNLFIGGKTHLSTRPFILIELHSLTLMKVLNRCHVFNQENSFIKVLGNLARFFFLIEQKISIKKFVTDIRTKWTISNNNLFSWIRYKKNHIFRLFDMNSFITFVYYYNHANTIYFSYWWTTKLKFQYDYCTISTYEL